MRRERERERERERYRDCDDVREREIGRENLEMYEREREILKYTVIKVD